MAVVPVLPNAPTKTNSVLEVSRVHPAPLNVMPGETLTVTVTEKLTANRYLLAVKETVITATSDVPLSVGEKLQVKVQSLHPQILLNMLDAQKQSTDVKVNERLLQWRMNPDSLVQLLGRVAEVAADLKSGDVLPILTSKKIDNLIKLFNNIVFSSATKTNPLFVKNFASQLGLQLESDLARMAVLSTKDGGAVLPADNLKASLLSLSAALTEALTDPAVLDATTITKLAKLSSFAADALKAIEARQVVNVVYQRNESGLYLQIPLAQGEMLRSADIFIRPDNKNAKGTQKFSSCSVIIFLDLDYLGQVSIDASVREGHIRCVIKCENETVKDLFAASADQLKEALGGLGYGVEPIECLKVSDIAGRKAEYREQELLGFADLINHFA